MRRAVVARAAGAGVLIYRITGVTAYFLYENSLGRGPWVERLAAVEANAGDLRSACIVTLINLLCGLLVTVWLYLYTRSSGVGLATFGLIARSAEAALYGMVAVSLVAMVSIAASSTEASRAIDARLVREIGLSIHRIMMAASIFFAAAHVAFAWLLIRARLAPRFIAVLGLAGAIIPLAGVPLQMIGATRGFQTELLWITMFLFELLFGIWLLATGGRDPS